MRAEDPTRVEQFARLLRWTNLHEEAAALDSNGTWLSLAALGQREQALEAMAARLAKTDDPAELAKVRWETYVALGALLRTMGETDKASEVGAELSDSWTITG